MPAPTAIKPATEFQKKLDRAGYLLLKEEAAKKEPWRAELAQLLKDIHEYYAKHPGDRPIRAEGQVYYIDLTKRENQRKVTNKKKAFDALKKAMGVESLAAALSYPFKLLDLHVSAVDQARFVSQERTGSRDISATLKAVPEVAA